MGGCEESKLYQNGLQQLSRRQRAAVQNLTLAAVQNTRNRHAKIDLKNTEAASGKLTTKTVKAVTQGGSAIEAEVGNSLEINYEKAAALAIKKVKQDLATKEIEQRLRQGIGRQKLNETLCRIIPQSQCRRSQRVQQTVVIKIL